MVKNRSKVQVLVDWTLGHPDVNLNDAETLNPVELAVRSIKIFYLLISMCFVSLLLTDMSRIISVGVIVSLSIGYFVHLLQFEKKMKLSLDSFQQASGKVSRASFRLTDTSKKLKAKNESVQNVFNESRQTIEGIAKMAQDNLVLVEENQKQNEISRAVASEGQATLGSVISEIKHLAESSAKIKAVTDLIDDISLKTNILSLNAAVEAARAGEQGRGFSVVADAVRDLAGQSIEATKTINSVIESVVERAEIGAKYADQSGDKIKQILAHIESSAEMSHQIHADTESQNQKISTASDALKSIQNQTTENTLLSIESLEVATDLSLQAAALETVVGDLSEIFQVDVRSAKVKTTLAFARSLSHLISGHIEKALELSGAEPDILLEYSYSEIAGQDINSLVSLFEISRVPTTGFNPKKYHTNYDHFFGLEIQAACDQVFKLGPDYLFALPVDLNAYAPIHNKKYCKAWTGDPALDLAGNRVKRFFYDNLTFLKSARVGLGATASQLPQVIKTRVELERSGCDITESKASKSSYLVLTYLRDTGEVATNLSVPIFIRGHRFGTIVVCWLDA